MLKYALAAASLAVCLPAMALAQDATHGAKVFASDCSSCHSVKSPPQTLVGPSLLGVVGRKAGAEAGFKYSKAMATAGFVWTVQKLDEYLEHPQKEVPANHMPFGGLANAKDRSDLIAYLAHPR